MPIPLKGSGCCPEGSVIQSVKSAGLKIMIGHRQVVEQAAFALRVLARRYPSRPSAPSIDRLSTLEEVRQDLTLSNKPHRTSIDRSRVNIKGRWRSCIPDLFASSPAGGKVAIGKHRQRWKMRDPRHRASYCRGTFRLRGFDVQELKRLPELVLAE
jgi:hypothetical protein